MAAKRTRGLIAAAAVAAAAVIFGYIYFVPPRGGPAPKQALPPATTPQAAPAAPAKTAAKTGPQFDVLRVDSAGNAVIAGRADPGATVTIKDGDTVIGKVTADANGAFAFLPASPLPPGTHQLTLSETLPDGQQVQGETSASVDVAPNASGQSLTVITGPNGSRIVSGQGPVPGHLGISAVDYDANGHAIISGTAHAGDHVSISLNGTQLGTAITGPDGRWSFTTNVPERSGTLRVTDVSNPKSPVLEAPFALDAPKIAVKEGHVVITPGQNLWLIARHIYGKGMLYTLIYDANKKQIQNPNLIFPGQALTIPKPK